MRPRYPRPVYLSAPVRTPIGKFGGALADRTAADLGTHAARASLERKHAHKVGCRSGSFKPPASEPAG